MERSELGSLILDRKVGQKTYIGPDICIEVTEVRGNLIRLRITAPKDMEIRREEYRTPKVKEVTKDEKP